MELKGVDDVKKVAKLEGSKRMADTLKVCLLSSWLANKIKVLIMCTKGNRAL